mgnify:CR=1 FL=1
MNIKMRNRGSYARQSFSLRFLAKIEETRCETLMTERMKPEIIMHRV